MLLCEGERETTQQGASHCCQDRPGKPKAKDTGRREEHVPRMVSTNKTTC